MLPTRNSLGGSPAAPLIIFRECLLTWQGSRCQNISEEEKCHWRRWTYKAGTPRLSILQKKEDAVVNGTLEKLAGMMDTPLKGPLGASVCNDAEAWKYFIAVASTKETDDFDEYIVPASTWAVFPGSGTNQSIQELEQRIVTEWLPTSGYEYGNAQYEVWIPVTKK